MDLQIKNQQVKDKDICENSEVTEELNCPKEAESGFLEREGKESRKEGWALFLNWGKKKGNNLYKYGEIPLFSKMLSLKRSVKNLKAKQHCSRRQIEGCSMEAGSTQELEYQDAGCWGSRRNSVRAILTLEQDNVKHFRGVPRNQQGKQIDSNILNFNRKVRIWRNIQSTAKPEEYSKPP